MSQVARQWCTSHSRFTLFSCPSKMISKQTNQNAPYISWPGTIPSNIKGFRTEELRYYDAHIICLADIVSPWADQVYFLFCCLLELFDQCPVPARGFQDQDMAWLALVACWIFVITACLCVCNDIACSTFKVVKSGAMLSSQGWLLHKITLKMDR